MSGPVCDGCGGLLPPPREGGQRRFCPACRPSRVVGSVGSVGSGGMVDSLLVEFEGLPGLAESDKALLLILAGSMDAGGHSGASLAALAGRFSRAKREAFEAAGVDVPDDGPDFGVTFDG